MIASSINSTKKQAETKLKNLVQGEVDSSTIAAEDKND